MEKILEFISKANYTDCLKLETAIEIRLIDVQAKALTNIPNHGELISIDDFVDGVIDKVFTANDGIGYYATSNKYSKLPFIFYDVDQDFKIDKYGFTHILWFNK